MLNHLLEGGQGMLAAVGSFIATIVGLGIAIWKISSGNRAVDLTSITDVNELLVQLNAGLSIENADLRKVNERLVRENAVLQAKCGEAVPKE